MKKFLSILLSRQLVAFVLLMTAGLVIWFLGPFIAFDDLRPLAGIGMRVLVIVLLVAGVLLWLADKATSPVWAVFLCLLIWYAAPLLSVGDARPFAPERVRLVTIAIVMAVFVGYGLFLLWRRMCADETFLQRLLQFGRSTQASPAADALRKVNRIVDEALACLKAMRTGARGLGRLVQGKRYLYALPWYITLGSSKAGKTGALLNAGLRFPVAKQMRCAASGQARGTAHVDWWLTNDAVLIDTAGRYTRHGTLCPAVPPAEATATDPVNRDAADLSAPSTPPTPSASSAQSALPASELAAQTPAAPADRAHADKSRRDNDAAEWLGFLKLLRKHRPRIPVNGALLMIDVAELIQQDEHGRLAEAAALRARLADVREALRIRFPVYLVITKMDRLTGFSEYFQSLTAEGRAQAWGFTVPYGRETIAPEGIGTCCGEELGLLASHLADGVNTRLQDEYDVAKRKQLVALSEEFAALAQPLVELIESVFLDSHYDSTQLHATLRGVYFTSAVQVGDAIPVEQHTVTRRMRSAFQRSSTVPAPENAGHQSYFLQDLLGKVVFPDARLAQPNLHWEFRFRVLRLMGHALALSVFAWLSIGLWVSRGNNQAYLDAIDGKTRRLADRVTQWHKTPRLDAVPDTLTEARDLAAYSGLDSGLDLAHPGGAYRYGLYAAPAVVAESRRTYGKLEDNLLLPSLVGRMEAVLSQAIVNRDAETAYDTLRVYLMLHDGAKYNADDVKAWVLDDWARTDSASVFGGRASMIGHVQQLFSGERVVQSPFVKNEPLIRQARAFLDVSDVTQRLYERAKAAMRKDAPAEFTLLRAVGPQAGSVFTRASGAPLSHGIPGLFTLDGYRRLFDRRLSEFVQLARQDDAWVMGRPLLDEAWQRPAALTGATTDVDDPLTEAIRHRYLTEYTQHWDAFLADIRIVTGTSLAFDLQVLRSFAAPDSPLVRLARAAVRETTLSMPSRGQPHPQAGEAPGIHAQQMIERELVDNHFAALREVVARTADGQATAPSSPPTAPSSPQTTPTPLDGITNLLNEYHMALTVADSALAHGSLPPASDAAKNLKVAADTMPAPLREVLLDLVLQGSREVNQGIGQLLSRQIQVAVGDACRRTVDGNYPFVQESRHDTGIDDFTRLFAQGGVIDDFFTKTLAPFVDTSAKPWHYKTLPGATEPVRGPDLAPFERAKAIRDVFFAEAGQTKPAWKADIRVPELDPAITGLLIDIDGQTLNYRHGPVAPFRIAWPGPRGGAHAQITASPRLRVHTSTLSAEGPWALMRLMQQGRVASTATRGRTRVVFDFDGRKVVLDVTSAGSVANPLTSGVLKTFRCPGSTRVSTTVPDFAGESVGLAPKRKPAGSGQMTLSQYPQKDERGYVIVADRPARGYPGLPG